MNKSVEDLKSEIINTVLPAVQDRIEKTLNTKLDIEIAWDTLDQAKIPERAYEALTSWNGYFVFGRFCETVEYICNYYWSAKERLPQRIKKVLIMNGKNKSIRLGEDNVLVIESELGVGSIGVLSVERMKQALSTLIGIAGESYKKQILEDCIPKAEEEVKKILGKDIKIEFDFSTIEKREEEMVALQHLAYWHGYYSFQRIPDGIRYAIDYKKVGKEDLCELFSKVIVKHIPGRWVPRYCYIEDDVLYCIGAFEMWWGMVDSYKIANTISWETSLNKLEKYYDQHKKLDEEQQKQKIDILKDICRSDLVQSGYYQVLVKTMKRRIFLQPDEADTIAFREFMEKYVNGTKKENEPKETFIHGWNIKKINFRGQVQERLMCITNEALYTFAWNYAKKTAPQKRIHRYEWDVYKSMTIAELRQDDKTLLKGKEQMGFRFASTLPTSKTTGITQQALSKAIGKNIFKILKFLVEKQVPKKDHLVEFVDLPPYNKPSFICELIAKSLSNLEDIPQVELPGFPPGSLIDVFGVMAEVFEKMSEQPTIVMPNFPNRELNNILGLLIDQLENLPDLNIIIPMDVSISNLLKSFKKEIMNMKDQPKFVFPEPVDLTFADLCSTLKEVVMKAKEKPKMEIKGLGEFPDLEKVVEALANTKVPDLKFEPMPELKMVDAIDAISTALSKLNLQPTGLLDLEIPGLNLKSLPGLPKLNVNINIPGGNLLAKFSAKEPEYWEFLAEPIIGEFTGGTMDTVCQEICWSTYGAATAGNTPYSVWSPWHTWYYVPNSYFATLYNAIGGKQKKVVPEDQPKPE